MILRPQTNFTIVRQLARPLEIDPTVFYVRAVVRNAYDETTLATLNLTDQGNNRFTKTWQTPNDPGNGLWISITTSVYEDSGYTTKSSIYGDDERTYLVERVRMGGGGSIGWVPDRDFWKKLVETIAEAIKMPETDLSKIEKAIVNIPKTSGFATPTDIQTTAEKVLAAISAIPKEKPEKVDLMPIVQEIRLTRSEVASVMKAFRDATVKLETSIRIMRSGSKEDIEKAAMKLEEAAKALQGSMQTAPFVMFREPEKKPERKPVYSLR